MRFRGPVVSKHFHHFHDGGIDVADILCKLVDHFMQFVSQGLDPSLKIGNIKLAVRDKFLDPRGG